MRCPLLSLVQLVYITDLLGLIDRLRFTCFHWFSWPNGLNWFNWVDWFNWLNDALEAPRFLVVYKSWSVPNPALQSVLEASTTRVFGTPLALPHREPCSRATFMNSEYTSRTWRCMGRAIGLPAEYHETTKNDGR